MRPSFAPLALPALLALLPAPALRAQGSTHLNVKVKQVVRLDFAFITDGSGTLPYWTEYLDGAVSQAQVTDWTVADKHLVITDMDVLEGSSATLAFLVTLTPLRLLRPNLTTNMLVDQVRTTQLSAGQETFHKAFTAGVAVPPGFVLRYTPNSSTWAQ